MTWEEYNDKVWDWAISTAVNRLSSLESLGDSTEVAELINHFGLNDRKAADKLLKRALAEGIKFNVDDIFEIKDVCSPQLFQEVMDVSAPYFKKADLEELYGFIDDEMLLESAKKYNIPLPEDLEDEQEKEERNINNPITWEEFYDKYSFWEDEYSKKRAWRLIDYGKSEEERLEVLNFVFGDNEIAASAFVENMLDKGIIFSADALIEIFDLCDEATLEKAVMQSSCNFDENDLETLYGCIKEELIIKVAKKRHLPLPGELADYTSVKQKGARRKGGYQYRPSECLALGLYPDDKLYKLYLRYKVLMGDKW